VDGFGGGHFCPGTGTGVEGVGVEHVAEVIDRSSKPDVQVGDRVVGGTAAEGGGNLCRPYSEGRSIDALARQFEVNRTTIVTHLDRAGIERRRVARKMTDDSVAMAATRYGQGASLAVVAQEFDVRGRILAREFCQPGVSIRSRHGC
jgi:hypothetical protein